MNAHQENGIMSREMLLTHLIETRKFLHDTCELTLPERKHHVNCIDQAINQISKIEEITRIMKSAIAVITPYLPPDKVICENGDNRDAD